ncbi:hypothetical protein M3Y99_00224900 [Aphelenchoides fujianensis]|nr:hypothetical protein M3Y99_00224900 [Aphelenchoides fujianensis]
MKKPRADAPTPTAALHSPPPPSTSGAPDASASTAAAPQQPPSLYQLLKNAELLEYSEKLRTVLKLRHAGDLAYAEEKDLSEIGMSRPEQKRLRREYARLFPQSSVFVRLRKVFGRADGRQSGDPTASTSALPDEADGQHIIPADAVELYRELGRGEFGVCFQGTWNLPHGDSLQVAIKRVPPEKLRTNPACFLQEAAVMTRMRHEHVVRMFGVVLDTKSVMLVSELAPYGSLLECLKRPAWDEPFAVDTLCEFARQIACGMEYLTNQRLIHRDLAARNVLVATLTKVKISDFGLSRSLGVGEDYYRSDFSPTMRLPIAWCAPECINLLRFTEASDVYAFGVLLWECFSYGRIPWENCTGAQILHSIDTQRKTLDCPPACPTEFYQLMQRCWRHEADQRPKFEEISQLIPEIMPQLLVTVSECHNDEPDQLQFDRGEIIILLDKCRNTEAGGSFWHGALRNGRTGLFRPAETVAHLGAENPTAASQKPPAASPPTAAIKPTSASKEKKSKGEKDKEKRKLLISEPQGDLRHTCHVGVDGKVFGLIHVGKGDLQPLIGLSDPATLQPAALAGRSIVPLRPTRSSNDSLAISPTRSTNSGVATPPLPPPTLASVRGAALTNGGRTGADAAAAMELRANGYDVPQRAAPPSHSPTSASTASTLSPRFVDPAAPAPPQPQRLPRNSQSAAQPPALPPKPAARIKPQRSLTHEAEQKLERKPKTNVVNPTPAGSRPFPLAAHRTQSLPKTTADFPTSADFAAPCAPNATTHSSSGTSGVFSGGSGESGRFDSWDSRAPTEPADQMHRSLHDSSQLLDEVLSTLQRDITDFSISTIGDYSDTRPLLPPRSPPPAGTNGTTSSDVRPLTAHESERLYKRMNDEHKKAARSLAKEFAQFKRFSSVDNAEPECGAYTAKITCATSGENGGASDSSSATPTNPQAWSDEAQAAYKLLVQCGDSLRRTSPVEPRAVDPHRPTSAQSSASPRSLNAQVSAAGGVSSSTDTDATVIRTSADSPPPPPLPQKPRAPIEYTNILMGGGGDEMERCQVDDQRRQAAPIRYENSAGGGANEPPPQIPPKPKARQNLTRSNAFAHSPPPANTPAPFPTFTPSVPRTALFSNFPKDEIVKF